MSDPRRLLPSVGALLEREAVRALGSAAPREMVVNAARHAIDRARHSPDGAPASDAEWAAAVTNALADLTRPSLRPVLNASGVVLHTNLGRSPLSDPAVDAMVRAARGYSNLELDLESGERGSRYVHCVSLLRELTGATDALVVNNGAAALLLALDTFARGREAVVSRGELIEIGGSFRVPQIMEKSGARLVEVGTTNRTHVDDYRKALGQRTGAIVKVHRSNFAMEGFVAEVSVRELRPIAREAGAALIHDLGSGLFISLESLGLTGEPLAAGAVRDGATVVTMSGDKLMGGPQAGIALGDSAAIEQMRRNPLTRALRVDKLTLAALEATLAIYRDPGRAVREIPVLRLLAVGATELERRARNIALRLTTAGFAAEATATESQIGGGAFPNATLPSAGVALEGDPASLSAKLRAGNPAVIGRISGGRLLLDLRAVPEQADEELAAAVMAALA